MKVIEKNVITGKVTERNYTQKELDAIAVNEAGRLDKKKITDKQSDIDTKRNAAVEEILLAGTSAKAIAYQDAIK